MTDSSRQNVLLDFWSTVDELVVPELELRVFDKFDERDEKTPRMRSVDNQSLQQDSRDLLLDRLRVGLGEQVEQRAAEVVSMAVGIAQLIRDGIQEQISTCRHDDKRQHPNAGDLQHFVAH